MPKLLNLKTDCGLATIELLDNEFVDFWLEHFLSVQPKYNIVPRIVSWPYGLRPFDSKEVTECCLKLINTITKINSLEYLVPIPEPVTIDSLMTLDLTTQQLLNRLHRYLVVATEYKNRWVYDSEPVFTVANDDEFMYLLNLANQTIHALEEYVNVPHRRNFNGAFNFCQFQIDGSKYSDVDVYADGVDIPVPEKMLPYLRLFGYDVWVKKDILGKDFVTAFADHDDPNNFDVRSSPMISGGFIVDQDRSSRQRFFKKAEFINWLGCQPTDYHGSYPLGNVILGKDILFECKSIENATVVK